MSHSRDTLINFAQIRDRLIGALDELADVLNAIDAGGRASEVKVASQNLRENRFRVVVIGELKRGKSTLINAMMGEELLPANPGLACTAIPIRVTFGTVRRAVCYKRTGEPPLECMLPEEVMRMWEAVTIPPKDLRVGPDDESWAIRNHPYERAEITAPVGLLKYGVELEDSPGLNEDSRRSDMTWNQVVHADAVVFVLDGFKVVSATDREDLQRLWNVGRDPRGVFVVWNQIDRYGDNHGALEQARQVAIDVIRATGISRDHIFFVSGQSALQGRLRGDRNLVEASGVPAFEDGLGEFLARERSAIKLLTPLNIARRTVDDALGKLLPRQVQAWTDPVRIASEAQAQARKLMQPRRRVRALLSTTLERAADEFRGAVATSARDFVQQHLKGIEDVVDSVPLTSREAVFESKASMQRLTERAEQWLLERASDWERCQLLLLAASYQTEVQRVSQEAAIELDGLRTEAAEIERQLLSADGRAVQDGSTTSRATSRLPSQDDLVARISSLGVSPDSGMSVLAGVGFGALIGGICAAWLSALFLLPAIMALLPAIVVGIVVAGKSAAGMLKSRAVEAIQQAMRDGSAGLESRLTAKIDETCSQINSAIMDWLSPIEAETDRCLAAIEAHVIQAEQEHRDRIALSGELESHLRRIELEIDELVRNADPAYDEARLAARIGREIEAKFVALHMALQCKDRNGGQVGQSAATALEAELGSAAWARLQAVKRYLETDGHWQSEMEHRLAAIWRWCDDALRTADGQRWVMLAVTAIAIRDGETNPPSPSELRDRIKDPEYRKKLDQMRILITGNEDEESIAADESVYKNYLRAYNRLVPQDSEGHAVRPGTVVRNREREPYRPAGE